MNKRHREILNRLNIFSQRFILLTLTLFLIGSIFDLSRLTYAYINFNDVFGISPDIKFHMITYLRLEMTQILMILGVLLLYLRNIYKVNK